MSRPLAFRRWLPVVLLSSLALALLLRDASQAQTDKGKKYALLVGVREYDSVKFPKLAYTENDAEDLAGVLDKAGFSVRVLTSSRGAKRKDDLPTVDNLRAAVKALLARRKRTDTILVALAGHGMQARVKEGGTERDESFFCPSDAQVNDTDTLLGLTKLFADLDACGAGVKLLLVDACRNEPGSRGFRNFDTEAVPRPARGIAALFSCSSGQRAFETDELGGRGHGVFFHFVLEGLKGKAKNSDNEVTWSALADHVTRNVNRTVPKLIGGGAKQTPHEIKNLEGESPVLVAALGAGAGTEKPGVREKVVADAGETITNSIGMKLVRIKAGSFTRGGVGSKEHKVTISKAFCMGIYPVTQGEYEKVIGSNPSWFSDGSGGKEKVIGNTSRYPVESVSWEDAVAFCDKLSDLDREKAARRVYRLPTEAEWEYACRAGTKTRYYSGDDEDDLKNVGWYSANSGARTHEVGEKKKPNAWGLHDMHGNVWQWCADRYAHAVGVLAPHSHRMLRGGSWDDFAKDCCADNRYDKAPDTRTDYIGFRVVCAGAGAR
jgi:formylglycine-generating enzyme required for sulfatase activity